MPDLPPLARISAAIEKLERLKAESAPGPWTYRERLLGVPNTTITSGDGVHVGYASPMHTTAANAHLIVTLHRTIDAQLAILRDAEARHLDRFYDESWPLVLALASAILGGES